VSFAYGTGGHGGEEPHDITELLEAAHAIGIDAYDGVP
jgi:hypothetical protein